MLLVTKSIAQRRKDADDILVLTARLGLTNASVGHLETLIYRPPTAERDRSEAKCGRMVKLRSPWRGGGDWAASYSGALGDR